MANSWRLGLDMGWNSLGWCALGLNAKGRPIEVLDLGVRLYADGRDAKTETSLAADRRLARQMRRNRDRYLGRRTRLIETLVAHGLMPKDKTARKALETLDPWGLRAKGLVERLEPHALGRALFHLHQHRGFKSTRKGAAPEDAEGGKIDTAIERLKAEIDATGAKTLGAFLAVRNAARQSVRARLQGTGKEAAYPFYPQRALVEAEFDALWDAQRAHHPGISSDDARDAIKKVFFEQRELKPVNPGTCTFEHPEPRAPSAVPLFQRFRIWQELNNLKLENPDGTVRDLDKAERDRLYVKLHQSKALSFDRMRKILDIDESRARFSLERIGRDKLDGDLTGAILSGKKLFGPTWWKLADAEQDAFVERLIAAEDDDEVAALAAEFGLDARTLGKARLPEGYARLGRTALAKILPHMRDSNLRYDQACEAAGYDHSDFRGDGSAETLSPYQVALDRHVIGGTGDPAEPGDPLYDKKRGRFPNPTVHIGLNQLRLVVNALIARHGKPAEIVVELARELKQSKKQRDDDAKRNAENRKKNADRREKIAAAGGNPESPGDMRRFKIWEELARDPLQRQCVYSGKTISAAMLFSGEVAVDHVLPFKETFDDSLANQIVCLREWNDRKGKRSPFQAFGNDAGWPDILARAQSLPPNKRWRFQPDALERKDGGDWIARQLNDTKYMTRVAREYLESICPSNKVWATPGQLTALLRGKWGLNSVLSDSNAKDRSDHRHHAIDAFVIGCTDRATLLALSTAAARGTADRLIEKLDPPWPGFDRDKFRERVRATTVALRPDRGRGGRLHEQTAYGPANDTLTETDSKGREKSVVHNLVYRKTWTDLTESEAERIRDPGLRMAFAEFAKASGLGWEESLARFRDEGPDNFRGIRHVRVLKKEDPAGLVPIRDRAGHVYKTYSAGENFCIDLYRQPDGEWVGIAISRFEANQPGGDDAALQRARKARIVHPAARKLIRLHKGDFLKLDVAGIERVMRVVRLNISGNRLYLAPHNEAGELAKRHEDRDDPFRWDLANISTLRERKARRVEVG
ncbi:MAG: type II CRISPR RNA-guided endonuclease Cas9, partial [Tagaea sp.]|nr:type II CRISPR RNA-guided endonuclease Cas9 [Tagaea sp.]